MNTKEIGGYLGLESFSAAEYYPSFAKLNSARNALVYLLKARHIKKLYIPRYLCDSVSAACAQHGCHYTYYSIGYDFLPVLESPADDTWVYLVNYYGILTNDIIQQLHQKYPRLIVDNVQAFFQPPVPGVDTLYSCRKYFGVPDGAYLSTDARLDEPLPLDVSMDRMQHILGRFEHTGAAFYNVFQKNDEQFDTLPLRQMSLLTQNLLGAIDYTAVRHRRNENYAVLAQALEPFNSLPVCRPDGPYCYPFYCKNGMQIKKTLSGKKIYVPTLWPELLSLDECAEKDMAENILPLPCDQRYTPQDMQLVIQEVMQCLIP